MRSLYYQIAQRLEDYYRFDARYFLSGGFWLSLTQAISIILGLISTALFAHFLDEATYGIYRYILGLAVIFSTLSLTGLGQSILQTAAKGYFNFYQETIRYNFLYSLAIVLFAGAGAVYYWSQANILLAGSCLLIALFQPFISTFQFVPAYLQGVRQFRTATINHALRTTLVSLVSIGTLWFTSNILLLITAYLGSNAFVNIMSYLWYQPRRSTPTPPTIFTQYLTYARNTSIRNVIAVIASRIDTIIVFTQLGAVELAIYTIATVIPEQIKGSFKNLVSLLLPKFAKQDNTEILKLSVSKRSWQLGLILCLITVIYIVAAPLLFTILFPKYEEAIFLSQVTALAFPAFILLLPNTYLQSMRQESNLYQLTVISSIVQIVTVAVLTHLFGILGAIIAKIVYRYIYCVITFYTVFRNT